MEWWWYDLIRWNYSLIRSVRNKWDYLGMSVWIWRRLCWFVDRIFHGIKVMFRQDVKPSCEAWTAESHGFKYSCECEGAHPQLISCSNWISMMETHPSTPNGQQFAENYPSGLVNRSTTQVEISTHALKCNENLITVMIPKKILLGGLTKHPVTTADKLVMHSCTNAIVGPCLWNSCGSQHDCTTHVHLWLTVHCQLWCLNSEDSGHMLSSMPDFAT